MYDSKDHEMATLGIQGDATCFWGRKGGLEVLFVVDVREMKINQVQWWSVEGQSGSNMDLLPREICGKTFQVVAVCSRTQTNSIYLCE